MSANLLFLKSGLVVERYREIGVVVVVVVVKQSHTLLEAVNYFFNKTEFSTQFVDHFSIFLSKR